VVNVRSLFPVHFDRNVIAVQPFRYFFVLERLPFHDVAPVASGITDGEEDKLVLVFGSLERFFTPRIPIDRVVGVLQKVGRLFMD